MPSVFLPTYAKAVFAFSGNTLTMAYIKYATDIPPMSPMTNLKESLCS